MDCKTEFASATGGNVSSRRRRVVIKIATLPRSSLHDRGRRQVVVNDDQRQSTRWRICCLAEPPVSIINSRTGLRDTRDVLIVGEDGLARTHSRVGSVAPQMVGGSNSSAIRLGGAFER